MSDWLHDDQMKSGSLFWIVDGSNDSSAGSIGLRYNIPLLVPETTADLKKICITFNCGLYFQNYLEAGSAILYLLNNEKERLLLKENGKLVPRIHS